MPARGVAESAMIAADLRDRVMTEMPRHHRPAPGHADWRRADRRPRRGRRAPLWLVAWSASDSGRPWFLLAAIALLALIAAWFERPGRRAALLAGGALALAALYTYQPCFAFARHPDVAAVGSGLDLRWMDDRSRRLIFALGLSACW